MDTKIITGPYYRVAQSLVFSEKLTIPGWIGVLFNISSEKKRILIKPWRLALLKRPKFEPPFTLKKFRRYNKASLGELVPLVTFSIHTAHCTLNEEKLGELSQGFPWVTCPRYFRVYPHIIASSFYYQIMMLTSKHNLHAQFLSFHWGLSRCLSKMDLLNLHDIFSGSEQGLHKMPR